LGQNPEKNLKTVLSSKFFHTIIFGNPTLLLGFSDYIFNEITIAGGSL